MTAARQMEGGTQTTELRLRVSAIVYSKRSKVAGHDGGSPSWISTLSVRDERYASASPEVKRKEDFVSRGVARESEDSRIYDEFTLGAISFYSGRLL